MNDSQEDFVLANNLSNICRICLQINDEMIDIFESGAHHQIFEMTKLKIESNDELPQALCQSCTLEVNQSWEFLNKVTTSDSYLRSILSHKKELEKIKSTNNSTQGLGRKGQLLELTQKLDGDKMYLFIVPENEKEKPGEIYVTDLSSENENLEIVQECRAIINNHFSNHTSSENHDNFSLNENNEQLSYNDKKENKVSFVNFCVLKCNVCNESFEEKEELLVMHFLMHDTDPEIFKRSYQCPVCDFVDDEKTNFLSHLNIHSKNEGVFFVNVEASGKVIVVKDNNDESNEPKNLKNGVYRVNLDSVTCAACFRHINSKDFISEHLASCCSVENIQYFLMYTCPICQNLFTEEQEFISHLKSYLNNDVYFVKVDVNGKIVDPDQNEMYVTLEEAKIIFEKKIYKIIEVCSCDLCDFESDTFESFSKHYENIHLKEVNTATQIICPVCTKEVDVGDVNNNRLTFYEHLKIHKNDGFEFVRVKKNGTLAENFGLFSSVFTQSKPVLNFLENKSSFTNICSPEVVLFSSEAPIEGYFCQKCYKKFPKKRELKKHLKSHELRERNLSYICEKCGKKYNGKANFERHVESHSSYAGSKKPVCMFCKKKFSSRASLKCHVSQHLREGKGIPPSGIMCDKCGESFPNNAALKKHTKLHGKDKENEVLKCEICDRDYYSKATFDRHKSAHLNPQYLECEVCRLPLPSFTSLQKHSLLHQTGSNTFDCKVCKISFLKKEALTSHQSLKGHHFDKEPFECNVCHEKFFVGKKFTNHVKTHPKYKMEKCTLCGKRLSTAQSLMLHMSRHFEYNSILCPHCGKQFFEEKNYHRHLLTHEGIKPYVCDSENCKKSFYTFFELNRHKKYHNNTRNFQCPFCSKGFHESNHLTVHVRTHTGERPYTCPHCEKAFATRSRCKIHIKKVHQGIGYDLIQTNISKKVTVFEPVETT